MPATEMIVMIAVVSALALSFIHLVRLVFMKRAADDRDADWHSWWAAMTFEVR